MIHDVPTGDAALPPRRSRARDPEPDHPTGAGDALPRDPRTLCDGGPCWYALPLRPDAVAVAPTPPAARRDRRPLTAVARTATVCGFGLARAAT